MRGADSSHTRIGHGLFEVLSGVSRRTRTYLTVGAVGVLLWLVAGREALYAGSGEIEANSIVSAFIGLLTLVAVGALGFLGRQIYSGLDRLGDQMDALSKTVGEVRGQAGELLMWSKLHERSDDERHKHIMETIKVREGELISIKRRALP